MREDIKRLHRSVFREGFPFNVLDAMIDNFHISKISPAGCYCIVSLHEAVVNSEN